MELLVTMVGEESNNWSPRGAVKTPEPVMSDRDNRKSYRGMPGQRGMECGGRGVIWTNRLKECSPSRPGKRPNLVRHAQQNQ